MGEQYFLVRRDAHGKTIHLDELDITSVIFKSDGDGGLEFQIDGYVHEKAPEEPMPTGEAFLRKYITPSLISGPD